MVEFLIVGLPARDRAKQAPYRPIRESVNSCRDARSPLGPGVCPRARSGSAKMAGIRIASGPSGHWPGQPES